MSAPTITNINISITTPPRRTRRRHVSIPDTALWTEEWWAAQSDPSGSVRRLISEDIQVHGISDLATRPMTPAATPVVTPATANASAFTAPTTSASSLDPRDLEIIELKEQLAKIAPFLPFFNVLQQAGVSLDI